MSTAYNGIDDLAVSHFIDALNDRELQLHVMQARPVTLSQALSIALEMESFMKMVDKEEVGSNKVTNRPAPENKQSWRTRPPAEPVVRVRPASLPVRPQTPPNPEVTCWRCGRRGHVRSQCRVDHLNGERRDAGGRGQGHPARGGRNAWPREGQRSQQQRARPAGNGDSLAVDAPIWPVGRN